MIGGATEKNQPLANSPSWTTGVLLMPPQLLESHSYDGSVLRATLCNKVCQWLTAGRWFSFGTPVFSTNKTNLHNITEILLKVALNSITLYPNSPSAISVLRFFPTGDKCSNSKDRASAGTLKFENLTAESGEIS
jgi:hypothetical protein